MIKNFIIILSVTLLTFGYEAFSEELSSTTPSSSPLTQEGAKEQMLKNKETASLSESPVESNKKVADKTKLRWQGSVMFDNNFLAKLYEVIASIENKSNIAAPSPPDGVNTAETKDPAQEVKIKPSPVFALNSVIYYGPESWTLWLNNKKIRRGQDVSIEDNIKVRNVKHDSAEFIWHSDNLDIQSPGWRDKLLSVDSIKEGSMRLSIPDKDFVKGYKWTYGTEDTSILADPVSGTIKLRLGINQTFISREMKIIEGIKYSDPGAKTAIAGAGEKTGQPGTVGDQQELDKELDEIFSQ